MSGEIGTWKLLLYVVCVVLIGWFYDSVSLEVKTWVLPLGIFATVGFFEARLRQLGYEARTVGIKASAVETQELSLMDTSGNQRIVLSTTGDRPTVVLYDEDHLSRVTLELRDREPVVTLWGDRARATFQLDAEGVPKLALWDSTENLIWSAP
jgi:hypothetical protein